MKYRKYLLFLALFILPSLSFAKSEYKFNIEDLKGESSHVDRTITVYVDLETSFTSIHNVSIYLVGYASSGEGILNDGSNSYIEIPVSFKMKISDEFSPGHGSLATPISEFAPLNGYFKKKKQFKVLSGPRKPNWDFLKDGYAEIQLSWDIGCVGCRYIRNTIVNIQQAILIVKGQE
jgi:hypothetical protein